MAMPVQPNTNNLFDANTLPCADRCGRVLRQWMAALAFAGCIVFLGCGLGTELRADDSRGLLVLHLQANVQTPANVLRLRDVCDLTKSDARFQEFEQLPIAPTPRAGTIQTWTREDLEGALRLRGIEVESIRWQGADEARVLRDAGATRSLQGNSVARTPNTNTSVHQAAATVPSAAPVSNDTNHFAPAFTSPVSISQAERVVASAIESYLHLKSGTDGKWIIKPVIPPVHAKDLMQRRHIISVAGGNPPWDGKQRFSLLVRSAQGESIIELDADVTLPAMVVAAKGPLAKGRVLQESDLVWLSLPPAAKIDPEVCFKDFESLIGKQLRRAVSTQQPIRIGEVGDPFAVQTGDSVTITVVSGAVSVETQGRAVESGAIDEVIQVEVLPQKKRIAARVAAERRVEVIAHGAPIMGAETPSKR